MNTAICKMLLGPKMTMLAIVIGTLLLRESGAVIYTLNESEYHRMPRLYALDDYHSCLVEPGGTYCLVDVNLFSAEPSPLMRMIREYSAHAIKHFNHTQIHRGVCVTETCRSFIQHRNISNEGDLESTLEECLNNSLWKDYHLQGKVADINYCNRETDKIIIDTSDIIVAAVYFVLITLNVIGSFYDVLFCKEKKSGNPFLLAFSIKRNWARLVAPSGGSGDPRMERLKLFHGMRAMTMMCVFFSHTTLIFSYSYVDNPLYIESAYEDPLKQLLFNGSLVVHTFFVMSSFLLAYNLELLTERHPLTWMHWPKGVLLRWLRLTPAYALVLATISTWMRHAGSGPLWGLVAGSEAIACRQYWWAHLLYVNNYVYGDAYCMPQTWYLAADTQLFCACLLFLVVVRGRRARIALLAAMFVASLVISTLHTYLQDLPAVVMQSPETYRSLYDHDDTFRLLYIAGHANLSTYTLGLAGGLIAYHWQKEGKDLAKYKKLRWFYWLLFPLGVAVILSGGLFYRDGVEPGTALRVLYASLYKPVFQLLVALIILGTVFKLDTVYRGMLEWRGWAWAGRAAYAGFLLHTMFQRGLIGSTTQPARLTDYGIFMVLAGTIFLSFLCAGVLFVLVEAPATALTKAALARRADEVTKV